MYLLPRLRNYHVRPEILSLDGSSAATHRLVKVPDDQLAVWDSTHDPAGRKVADRSESEKEESTEKFKV